MNRSSAIGIVLAAASLLAAPASAQLADPQVFINEIHYDNTGTDTGEFIEVAGPAGTDLSTYSLVLYNGSGGAVYTTTALTGVIPSQQGGFGTLAFTYPINGIQNGAPDGIALVQGTTVIQFLSYEGPMTAVGGAANGLTSTDIGVSELGTEPVGQSLRLTGTGDSYLDFAWASPAAATPGAVNTGQTFAGGNATPSVSINDVSLAEGNSGTVTATFTVTASAAAGPGGISFDIATSDNTATTADNDYVGRSLPSQTIPEGDTTFQFDVTVNGDTTFEANETFFVNVTNLVGANAGDVQGQGTITNDDVAPPTSTDVVISQVYGGGGNSGATWKNDFVELFNRGTTPVNLTGWSVQYVGATGTGTWSVTPLSGTIAPGGYYLVQQAAGTGGTVALPAPDATGTSLMSGTAGKVALQTNATAISGVCPSANNADLVGYGSTATTPNTCFEGAAPTAAPSNTTAALRKRGGCYDTDDNGADFSIGSPTPRNSASPTRSCTPTPLTISQIQGTGLASPFAGLDVSTSGVVTARKNNGFFMQTPDASIDADPQTSEGIFVFTSAAPAVAVGDAVAVIGTATEFFNLTQIEATLPGDVVVSTSGNALPAAVTLTPAILDATGTFTQLERFEGMRLFAPSLTSVAPTNEFGETSAVLTGVARPMREPGIPVSDPVPPDPTSGVIDCCIARFDGNPERIVVDSDGLAGATVVSVTSNVLLGSVTGPLDFTFSEYKLLPEAGLVAGPNMVGTAVPAPTPGDYTIAGFNIENFAGDVTRTKKASLAIRNLMRSPDIIGLIEISNLAALQGLATQINADAVAAGEPDPQYDARLVLAPTSGGGFSTQNVGFLVKTSRVRIDSVTQEPSGTFLNPVTNQTELLHDRPPLVLRATVDVNGPNPHPVIVVVNHLRSFIDIELVAGEGIRVRAKRTAQAESVAQLLQDLQALNPGVAVVSLGDYNAYQFSDGYTDPIAILKGTPTADENIVVDASPDLVNPNYVNLTDALPAAQQYSFVFEGTPQAIDHVLVNTVGMSYVTGYAVARGNADFPVAGLATDATRPERASDHDMPVSYFRFPDVTAPTIGSVANITVPATQPDGAVVTFTPPTADDNTDGPLPVTCAPASGSTFAVGTTTVTCSAMDAAGNPASTSFTVTVTSGTPRMTAQVVGATWSGTTATINVRFNNIGTGSAVNVVVDGLVFRTVAGTGTVTLASPSLPMAVGLILPGQSITKTLTLNVGSVTRFAITENGSLKTAAGSPLRFSSSQVVTK